MESVVNVAASIAVEKPILTLPAVDVSKEGRIIVVVGEELLAVLVVVKDELNIFVALETDLLIDANAFPEESCTSDVTTSVYSTPGAKFP